MMRRNHRLCSVQQTSISELDGMWCLSKSYARAVIKNQGGKFSKRRKCNTTCAILSDQLPSKKIFSDQLTSPPNSLSNDSCTCISACSIAGMPLLSATPHAAYTLKLLVNSSLLNTKNQLTHKLVISYQVDRQISCPNQTCVLNIGGRAFARVLS